MPSQLSRPCATQLSGVSFIYVNENPRKTQKADKSSSESYLYGGQKDGFNYLTTLSIGIYDRDSLNRNRGCIHTHFLLEYNLQYSSPFAQMLGNIKHSTDCHYMLAITWGYSESCEMCLDF